MTDLPGCILFTPSNVSVKYQRSSDPQGCLNKRNVPFPPGSTCLVFSLEKGARTTFDMNRNPKLTFQHTGNIHISPIQIRRCDEVSVLCINHAGHRNPGS